MSNLSFATPIESFSDADRFADGTLRKLCYATEVVPCVFGMSDRVSHYRVHHHGNRIAQFERMASQLIERVAPTHPLAGELYHAVLDTAGWDSATTATRLHRMIPSWMRGRRVSIGISDGQTVVRAGGFEYPMRRAYIRNDGRTIVESWDGRFMLAWEGLEG